MKNFYSIIFVLSIIVVAASCDKVDDPYVPQPNNTDSIPTNTDSIITSTFNTSFRYSFISNYPGWGDWDTIAYLPVDIDQDSVPDFSFKSWYSVTWLGSSTPYYDENVLTIEGDSINLVAIGQSLNVLTFEDSTVIDSSMTFNNSAPLHIAVIGLSHNYWPLINHPYHLGIKMTRNGLPHYGWITIQHLPGGYLLLNKTGFNTVPNHPAIIAPL